MTRGTLIVDRHSWHHKIYQHWMGRYASSPPPGQLNLCHYMRVVLIYAPATYFFLAFLAMLTVLTALLWLPFFLLYKIHPRSRRAMDRIINRLPDIVTFLIPIVFAAMLIAILVTQFLEAWWKGLAYLGGILLVLIAILGLIVLSEHLKTRRQQPRSAEADSSAKLAWAWVKGKKERICPLLKVSEGKPS
jgi:hypothetical protein